MVESSKILTVSYGTFSCTLEGFDDSFGTMKAIAEYFRDLAADDRYFGAEPPTPDAHMLAKIAEREITRRVDASTEDGEIVLRAHQAPAPAMPPKTQQPDPVQLAAAAVAPQITPEPPAPVAFDQTDDAPAAETDAPATSDLNHPDAESIAAKLQRIRAVVGRDAGSKALAETFADDADEIVDLDMPVIADTPEEDDVEVIAVADVDEDALTQDAEAAIEDLVDAVEDEMPEIADVAKDIAVEDVVGDVEAELQEVEDDIDTLAASIADAANDAIDQADEVTEPSDVAEETAPVDAAFFADQADDAAAVDDEDDEDAALLAGLTAKIAQSTAPEVETAPEAALTDASDAVQEIAEDLAQAPAEKTVLRAQVLRLRKADLAEQDGNFGIDDDGFADETQAEDDLLDVARLDGFDELDTGETVAATTLSEEDEAELLEELAEVEETYGRAEGARSKPRNQLPETDDATMSHILDQTDQELNEPEGNRRRNAIAQLKAAVAATEAARQLGDDDKGNETAENAFRGDLKEVVQPRRLERPAKSTARPARPRPEPLKLVASQRVDTPPSETEVAPRRVAAAVEPVSQESASNFAEFAESMGATALPDLLEAAAAYTAFVEGSEDFSRPQIMKKVQLSADVAFSREDGLRSFGTLLREGRISKVRNGRFQVSDETRFRPAG